MTLTWIFSINEDIIQINNDENIELLGQDLINITWKLAKTISNISKMEPSIL